MDTTGSLMLGLAVLTLTAVAQAAPAATAVGLWQTIDDNTHRLTSLVRITEVNGELRGVVEKIFDQPGENPMHLCTECKGDRKDKPILGMTILWGLRKAGDEWSGGEILDPENGKTYRCKMKVTGAGKKLDVRGFIGVSLFGRTQTWLRQE
jgi:uncharacterized protein (DUF2147 family)